MTFRTDELPPVYLVNELPDKGDARMPTQNFDEEYEPRPWACEECHRVLGVVMRVIVPRENNDPRPHKVRRLWVFRRDMDACDLPNATALRLTPRGMFKVHGVDQCHGVECSICGAINEWTMNKESYLRLISYYQGRL